MIIINEKLCIKCNTCIAVCAPKLIDKQTVNGYPRVPEEKSGYCFKCGHCEAFCPQKALTLDFLPEEKIEITDTDSRIEPQNLSLYIKKRRSIRHFTSETVSKDKIAEVLDVARYAATGGNGQPVKWLVIYEPSDVQHIARLTIEWMRTILGTSHPLAPYVSFLISAWDKGTDLICHRAPHLLFAHVPTEPINDPTEAVIALTHFDIAAPSFGLGTCWAGYVIMAMAGYKPLQDFLSLPEGRKVACPMLFGYPRYKITSIPRRNPVDVTWR